MSILGPIVCLCGMAVAVFLTWLYLHLVHEELSVYALYRERGLRWDRAGYICGALSVVAAGVGLIAASWSALFPRNNVARSLASAIGRHLRGRRGLVRRVFWFAVGLCSWGSVALLLSTDPAYRTNDYGGLMTVGYFFFSLIAMTYRASSAALNLSSSRRSGAAENLLLAPLAGDYLAWASTRAQSKAMTRSLIAMLPCCVIGVLMGADASELHPVWAALVAAAFVFSELLMRELACAQGTFWGASVGHPGLAAAIAGAVGALLWIGRLILLILGVNSVGGMTFFLTSQAFRWVGVAAAIAVQFALTALLVPSLLKTARTALCRPAEMPLLPWLFGSLRPGGSFFARLRRRAPLVKAWVQAALLGVILVALVPVLCEDPPKGTPGFALIFFYTWMVAIAVAFIYLIPIAIPILWRHYRRK